MEILVTSAESRLGKIIAEGLGASHTVHPTDDPGRATGNIVSCDLGHDEATDALCGGIDTIVHVCDPEVGLSDGELGDYHSRKTYNLLTAASSAGVGHVVFVSSLCLFDSSDSEYEIDEQWAPPVTTDIVQLRYQIAEFVCREFARTNVFPVTCLRFGEVVTGEEAPDDCVTESQLVRAVSAAVEKMPAGWSVFHIVSGGPHFLTTKTTKGLGLELSGGGGA
jgi:nucleoside-diphosphate-sugar epimerase